ncbi:hypothetical protein [Sulfurimonas sp.]|uniref:hypothetical protein n=1 Tax=Sulfurimonas sp. TaxID=2022749 RepID=UPI003D124198
MIKFKTNPFESGHIKNYMLLYVSVLVIMILFFIASELFIEPKEIEKKVFKTDKNTAEVKPVKEEKEEEFKPKFKLLEQGY